MALSDKPSRVSEKYKKESAGNRQKHNYRPNNAAVSLANKKSRLIGIVFNDLKYAYFFAFHGD